MSRIASAVPRLIATAITTIAIIAFPRDASATDRAVLKISPATSAVDQEIHISVAGLQPREKIIVIAEQQRFGFPLRSTARFLVDDTGVLDLSADAPISGDYAGVDPMGLFWSMSLIGKPHFLTSSAPEVVPFDVNVDVYHDGTLVARSLIHRYVVAPATVHQEFDRNGLVAAYYAPADNARHPGIIVLNGSDGGLERDTAALLARHGFCTLSVAYFGVGSLPKYLSEIPIETVERAIALLRSMPRVDQSKIGVVGFSKGAELALLSASRFSTIKAVVAYAPSSAVFEGLGPSRQPKSSWTFKGRDLPFASGLVPKAVQQKLRAASAAHKPVSYSPWYLAKLQGSSPSALIPVEAIQGAVLLIAGGDDQLWPSAIMARQIDARLRAHGHAYGDEIQIYAKAGHAIEVPFVPTPHTISAGALSLGGSAQANAHADSDSWTRVLAFLKEQLD